MVFNCRLELQMFESGAHIDELIDLRSMAVSSLDSDHGVAHNFECIRSKRHARLKRRWSLGAGGGQRGTKDIRLLHLDALWTLAVLERCLMFRTKPT